MSMKFSTKSSIEYNDMEKVKIFEYDTPETTLRVPREDPNVGQESCRAAFIWRLLRVAHETLKGKKVTLRRRPT